MLLQCLGNFIVKKLIKLTVGEGEAWSDIAFRDSCMKATNKEHCVGWETEPSHTHCPHASSGLPANLQYLPFRFLGNSWSASFLSRVYFLSLSLSLSLPAAPGSLNGRPMHCGEVGALLWACRRWYWFGMTICDLRTRQKVSTDQPPCVRGTTGSPLRSVKIKQEHSDKYFV